jgi:hypothetical protein
MAESSNAAYNLIVGGTAEALGLDSDRLGRHLFGTAISSKPIGGLIRG